MSKINFTVEKNNFVCDQKVVYKDDKTLLITKVSFSPKKYVESSKTGIFFVDLITKLSASAEEAYAYQSEIEIENDWKLEPKSRVEYINAKHVCAKIIRLKKLNDELDKIANTLEIEEEAGI